MKKSRLTREKFKFMGIELFQTTGKKKIGIVDICWDLLKKILGSFRSILLFFIWLLIIIGSFLIHPIIGGIFLIGSIISVIDKVTGD